MFTFESFVTEVRKFHLMKDMRQDNSLFENFKYTRYVIEETIPQYFRPSGSIEEENRYLSGKK